MRVCLGVDTSCYMTSAALCRLDTGRTSGFFCDHRSLRKPLAVRPGERGLQQSEALFQHVRQLPALIEELLAPCAEAQIAAVCASVKPRPAEDSYMPVFKAGEGAARAIASALRVPFFETSHQEGHLRAALVGTSLTPGDSFVAVHLSGGTTEVLHVHGGRVMPLLSTADLHAGQLIDRVGVAMGLPFPAGPALEALAMRGQSESRIPVSVDESGCHFSGAEAQAMRWIASGELSREEIAAEVFSAVARTVARLLLLSHERTGERSLLLSGGVASSSLIREQIRERLMRRNRSLTLHAARPDLSGDNAVGVALIGASRAVNTAIE